MEPGTRFLVFAGSLANAFAVAWDELRGWLDGRPFVTVPLSIALLLVLAWVSLLLVRATVVPAVRALVSRTPHKWDDVVLRHHVLDRLAYLVPMAVVYRGAALMESLPEAASTLLQRLALGCTAIVMARALSGFLAALNELYNSNPRAAERPIKNLLQVVDVVGHIAALIFVVAALLDRSPVLLLSGLGAMSAIVMLVFRDSILSLVAGMQVTRTDLIRIGDWIEMPQFNADGFVIDVALNNISVQNWDKTITVIPAHKFLENSFKNWRGMQQSGGRRIKRSVLIDLSTVRFLTDEEVEYFERFDLLRDYIRQKKKELEEHNRKYPIDPSIPVNLRRLTNLGTFRAYVERYLRRHPRIHQEGFPFLVRQLQPTEQGLPLEIYVFVNDVQWVVYESVQADIFDHILAAVPHFGLRVFQSPTGHDVTRALVGRENVAIGELPPSLSLPGDRPRSQP